MMFQSFVMQLMVDCGGCGSSVPVNGVCERVSCSRCGQDVELDGAFWKNAFEPGYFAEALGFEEGEGREVTQFGGHSAKIGYGRRRPRCQSCKGPNLEPEELAQTLAGGGCSCPACGQHIRIRPADELVRAIHPAARFMVGETVATGAAAELQKERQPVLLSCMGCGGGLEVDGSTRTVTCAYCNASNYLPDGLWQQLNPVPTMQAFFMVCEYDEASLSSQHSAEQRSASDLLELPKSTDDGLVDISSLAAVARDQEKEAKHAEQEAKHADEKKVERLVPLSLFVGIGILVIVMVFVFAML